MNDVVHSTDVAPGLGRWSTACTSLVTAVIAWFAVWSAPVNGDEGYLLLSLREWFRHGGLYDRVYSQYGPFYYALFGLPSRIAASPWTLGAGRWTTLVVWVVTAFLLGVTVRSITNSWIVGIAAQVIAFSMLSTLLNEPMHPGALLCGLLAALVANVSWARPHRPRLSDTLSGVLLAALLLTKVNVGVFAIVAFVFVVGEYTPRRAWRAVASLGFVACGPALLFSNGFESWRLLWASAYLAGAALVVLTSRLRSDTDGTRLHLRAVVIGFAATCGASVGFALATGTSLEQLIRGALLRPLDHPQIATIPVQLPAAAWCWLLLVGVLCLVWRRVRTAADAPVGRIVLAGGRIGAGVVLLVSVLGRDASALVLYPAGTRFALIPLVALVLLPRCGRTEADGPLLARRLLAAAAVTESLHAYPVPGSQISWSVLLVAMAATVVVADGAADLRSALPNAAGRRAPSIVAGIGCLAIVLVLPHGLAAGAGLPGRQFQVWVNDYRAETPLGLAGAGPLRTPAWQRQKIRQIAPVIRRSCDTFMPFGADLSWYIVSGVRPPTGFNHTAWSSYLDDREQRAIIRAWRRSPRRCLVLAGFGGTLNGTTLRPGPSIRPSPLVYFLARLQWTPVGRAAGVQVLREVP